MPFRAGLVTGQYCNIHGVKVHGDLLTPDKKTIAHAFRDAGYRTSYIGKWHLASTVSDKGNGGEHWVHPLMRGGFEDWYGFDVSNHYYNTCYSHGEFTDIYKIEKHQTEGLTDVSLDYLEHTASRLNQPWFHVLSLEAPHGGKGNGTQKYAYNPTPTEYEERFNPDTITLRENVPLEGYAYAKERAAGYYAMIEQLDDNVGRVLDWLDKSGEADNTLVVFFSDHGEMLGSHGRYEKLLAYEESICIPLIFRMPNVLEKGMKYDGLFSGIDIYPTCAGFCGVPIPADVQGIDLSSDIRGDDGQLRTEALIQWMGQSRYHWGDFPYRAIRTQRYTYCISSQKVNEENDRHICLLFDNENDPFQLHNLFGTDEYQQLQQKLHKQLCKTIINAGEELPEYCK